MYPQCRHVLAAGNACRSPALVQSEWCYFHARLYQRQGQQRAARHIHRRPDGRFAPLLPFSTDASSRPDSERSTNSSSRPNPERSEGEVEGSAVATETIDYGPYPVGAPCRPERSEGSAASSACLDLPPVEDTESIQLALIDVIQALAANRIDTKRAGLLLYGLQVASSNARKIRLPIDGVRTVTYTDAGAPLAPQDYGYDVEDYDDDEEDDLEEREYES